MLGGFENRHISPNLGNDITGGVLGDAWDVTGQLDQLIIGFGEFCDGIVQLADHSVKVVRVLPTKLDLEGLVVGNFITNDGSNDIISLILSPLDKKFAAVFGIKILPGEKILDDGGSGFAEGVREDGAEGDVGDGERILEPHLLAGALVDKLVAVAEKLPEPTDLLHRNVTGGNDVELEKVGDPHGILVVGFLALNSPDVFRVGDNDMEMAFQDIENGNPVFTGGFHADLRAVMAKEPVTAGFEVGVEGSEPLFLISGNALEVSGGDTDSDKLFVYVHTGTVVVNDTQHKKPPFKRSRN